MADKSLIGSLLHSDCALLENQLVYIFLCGGYGRSTSIPSKQAPKFLLSFEAKISWGHQRFDFIRINLVSCLISKQYAALFENVILLITSPYTFEISK